MSAEVDAENRNATSQEIIHLDAELEEDIGAEIEDLTLARRLGQHEDAVEVINTVLLRHVRHFPVFAEITGYLWRRDDLKMLDDVCSSLQQPDSTWEPTEVAYFEYMVGEKDRGSAKMNNAYLSEGVQRDPTSVSVSGTKRGHELTLLSYNSSKHIYTLHPVKDFVQQQTRLR